MTFPAMSLRTVSIFASILWCTTLSSQGLKLFSPEMKALVPKPQAVVMDFAERYLLELSQQSPSSATRLMKDDKVMFLDGSLSDLSKICDTVPCTIGLQEMFFDGALRRYYEVAWKSAETNSPILTVAFPAQYDLLLGLNKDEATLKFKDFIKAAKPRKVSECEHLEMAALNDTVFKCQGDTLILESLTDALYYAKSGNNFVPIFNVNQLAFSTANLFHGVIVGRDYRMHVEQSTYGMKTIEYDISLDKWLDYCSEWELKVYFAVEEEREDGLKALIIVQSKELGFNHLLSVIVPDRMPIDSGVVLKAQITPFIPIHNVKDLYQTESINHKKVKWQ